MGGKKTPKPTSKSHSKTTFRSTPKRWQKKNPETVRRRLTPKNNGKQTRHYLSQFFPSHFPLQVSETLSVLEQTQGGNSKSVSPTRRQQQHSLLRFHATHPHPNTTRAAPQRLPKRAKPAARQQQWQFSSPHYQPSALLPTSPRHFLWRQTRNFGALPCRCLVRPRPLPVSVSVRSVASLSLSLSLGLANGPRVT